MQQAPALDPDMHMHTPYLSLVEVEGNHSTREFEPKDKLVNLLKTNTIKSLSENY